MSEVDDKVRLNGCCHGIVMTEDWKALLNTIASLYHIILYKYFLFDVWCMKGMVIGKEKQRDIVCCTVVAIAIYDITRLPICPHLLFSFKSLLSATSFSLSLFLFCLSPC